jgi:ATP-dependent Clp protease ATP-binding subunit ClpC
MFVEDPLAEELLKGEFAGKDVVRVEVKKVGDKKQLVFEGLSTKDKPEPVPVGAGAGTGGGENATDGAGS